MSSIPRVLPTCHHVHIYFFNNIYELYIIWTLSAEKAYIINTDRQAQQQKCKVNYSSLPNTMWNLHSWWSIKLIHTWGKLWFMSMQWNRIKCYMSTRSINNWSCFVLIYMVRGYVNIMQNIKIINVTHTHARARTHTHKHTHTNNLNLDKIIRCT